MTSMLTHLVVTTVLLLMVANVVEGIEIRDWVAAAIAAVSLGIVNAIIRPIMFWLTIPVTIITFGLFLLVINALMLRLAVVFVPGMKVHGFKAALYGSILLTILNLIVGAVFGLD